MDLPDGQYHSVDCSKSGPDYAEVAAHSRLELIFPSQAWLDVLAEAKHVTHLKLEKPKAKSLIPLIAQPLQSLWLSYPSHVKEWNFLAGCTRLTELRLNNTLSLRDLEPVAELKALRTFAVSGGYSRDLVLPALQPLAALTDLRAVAFAAVRLKDPDLSALHGLPLLQTFNCPTSWPSVEVERLLAARPGLNSHYFVTKAALKRRPKPD